MSSSSSGSWQRRSNRSAPSDQHENQKLENGNSHDSKDDTDGKEPDDRGDGQREDPKDDEQKNKPMSPRKRRVMFIVIAALLIIGAAVMIPWYLHARLFEDTDDAFIDAHWEKTAPRIAGRVMKVLVDDNELVQAGQVLVEIDSSDMKVSVEQAEADFGEAQGKLAQAKAQKLVAIANVGQQQAEVDRQQVNRDNAATELQRNEGLSAEAISRQRLDDLRVALRSQDAQLQSAKKMLVAQQAQVDLADSMIQANEASVKSAQSRIDQANLNLSYAEIKAMTAGRVTRRSVQGGDYVSVAQQLMFIVPSEVWVTANFKETQLTDMKVNQAVDIEVDAFPGVDFKGKVQSIQAGSGPAFSLLPPENATGNYVKVVQRVPVKIIFDETSSDAYKQLGPGMSVVPRIRVR